MDNDAAKVFLKKYSPIGEAFIDDFFSLYSVNSRPGDFVVNLDTIATWLRAKKGSLKRTLVSTYTLDVDYSLSLPTETKRHKGRLEVILLTTDCFKTLCMQSKTPKAAEVRAYFVAVENTLFKYREDIVASMNKRIGVLERNQQSIQTPGTKGVIYVIKASADRDSVFKIGRTQNLKQRLRSHGSALADSLDVVYVYETACIEKVESCIKLMIKEKQYRKYKEVYQIDLDTLKKVISGCDDACLHTLYHRPRKSAQAGGFYAIVTSL